MGDEESSPLLVSGGLAGETTSCSNLPGSADAEGFMKSGVDDEADWAGCGWKKCWWALLLRGLEVMPLSRKEGAKCEEDSSLEDGGVTWRKGEPIGAGGIPQQQRGRQEGRGEERQERRGGGTLKGGWGDDDGDGDGTGDSREGRCMRQSGAAEMGQPIDPRT